MGAKGTPVHPCALEGAAEGWQQVPLDKSMDAFQTLLGTRLHHLCVRTAEGAEQRQPLGDRCCAALGLQGCLQWGFLCAKVFLMARGQCSGFLRALEAAWPVAGTHTQLLTLERCSLSDSAGCGAHRTEPAVSARGFVAHWHLWLWGE